MTRSYLFVPAHRESFVQKAPTRGADVVILDLEDSVPEAEKAAARAGLGTAVAHLNAQGQRAIVRVNASLHHCTRDLEAVVASGAEGAMIPKAQSRGQMVWIADGLTDLEARAGRSAQTNLIALIETPTGLSAAQDIATSSSRVSALAFGTEDFSAACHHAPSTAALTAPLQRLIWAAKEAGIEAIGLPDSLAVVKDEARFQDAVTLGKALGIDGALCIHPRQVAIVNDLLSPSENEIETAQRVIQAAQDAASKGLGAVMLDGEMIDPPIVQRAERVLATARPQKTTS